MIQRIITKTLYLDTNRVLFKSIFNFSTVRVRYAPSPTGMMHIGGLRTALFNYLYAKKYKGKFIVRIQDTDRNRHVQGSIQNIFNSLKWLNIQPDQSIQHSSNSKQNQKYGPYIQSQRLSIYKNIQKLLLKNNLAYPCFCLNQKRVQSNSQLKKKIKEKKQCSNSQQNHQNSNEKNDDYLINSSPYLGTCRNLTLPQIKQKILAGQKYAVRIKSNLFNVPEQFIDQNYGSVPFVKFDDFIIVKNDGWPTFHFANVIDDWKMEISHVIRGQQWLTNTSKHIYLYKLLGAENIPKFFHLPLIQNQNGKKLAKRDPSSSLATLKNQYQPQAIKNFIFRLGWNPKQQINQKKQIQLLSDEQMIQNFSQQGITKNPAKFDIKILNHLNRKCIKQKWKLYNQLKLKVKYKQTLGKDADIIVKQIQNLKKYFISKLKSNLSFKNELISQDKLIMMWQIIQDRITINSDIKQFNYFINDQKTIQYQSQKSLKDLKSILGPNTELYVNQETKKLTLSNYLTQNLSKNQKILHNLNLIFQHLIAQTQYTHETQLKIGQKISEYLYQNSKQIKNQQLYGLLRYIITGQKSGPNILKIIVIIGRERTLQLINNFHQVMKKQNNKIFKQRLD